MVIQFQATEIGCEDDGFTLVCGASNADSDEEYHYIIIQGCSDQADEDDCEDDDDGVHFQIDNQMNGNYDLLRACHVSRSQIRVELSRDVPWHPGLQTVVVDCSLSPQSDWDAFVAGLRRLFQNRPGDLILALS